MLANFHFIGLFTFKSFGLTEEFDKTKLQRLDEEFVNWNINTPNDRAAEEGNNCLIKQGEVNLLLDPFGKG